MFRRMEWKREGILFKYENLINAIEKARKVFNGIHGEMLTAMRSFKRMSTYRRNQLPPGFKIIYVVSNSAGDEARDILLMPFCIFVFLYRYYATRMGPESRTRSLKKTQTREERKILGEIAGRTKRNLQAIMIDRSTKAKRSLLLAGFNPIRINIADYEPD